MGQYSNLSVDPTAAGGPTEPRSLLNAVRAAALIVALHAATGSVYAGHSSWVQPNSPGRYSVQVNSSGEFHIVSHWANGTVHTYNPVWSSGTYGSTQAWFAYSGLQPTSIEGILNNVIAVEVTGPQLIDQVRLRVSHGGSYARAEQAFNTVSATSSLNPLQFAITNENSPYWGSHQMFWQARPSLFVGNLQLGMAEFSDQLRIIASVFGPHTSYSTKRVTVGLTPPTVTVDPASVVLGLPGGFEPYSRQEAAVSTAHPVVLSQDQFRFYTPTTDPSGIVPAGQWSQIVRPPLNYVPATKVQRDIDWTSMDRNQAQWDLSVPYVQWNHDETFLPPHNNGGSTPSSPFRTFHGLCEYV